jgi:transposase
MMRQRRKFTREFKVEAVRLSRQPSRSVGEAATSLDVGEGLLRGWRDEFAADGDSAFAGPGKQTGLEEENRKLRAEVDRLRMEREIFRPAPTFNLIVSV